MHQQWRHLRIQTSHDTLVEGFAQWFGDGRENKPGEQSGSINSYNGNNQDWNFKSTEAALADWRGLVFAQGKGGLGNQMWSAAATISVRYIYIFVMLNIIYIKGGFILLRIYVHVHLSIQGARVQFAQSEASRRTVLNNAKLFYVPNIATLSRSQHAHDQITLITI